MQRAAALAVLFAVAMPRPSPRAESGPYVVTSASRGVRHENWELTQRKASPKSAPWSITKTTLHGGKQEGVDLVTLKTAGVEIAVVPTRGMSVLSVKAGDLRLGWDSPVKELVHPQWINLAGRGGLGWLEGFNEWMVRCGLEWAGHPGKDSFTNNVGERAEMDLTLHGRIGNLPASEVEVIVDPKPPHRVRLRGRVDERMFYGPKLELWAEVSFEPGARRFRIEDVVKNHAAAPQEMQLIYHANFGPPLLGADARFHGAVKSVVPFNAHAAKAVDAWDRYQGPTAGFVEQVYCLTPIAGADGRTTVMLAAPGGERAAAMSFATAELPYLTLWKNTNALAEGYVTGLEPGTSFPRNRRLERAAGRVPKLGPGESRRFAVDVELLATKADVSRVAEAIAKLQSTVKAQLARTPEAP